MLPFKQKLSKRYVLVVLFITNYAVQGCSTFESIHEIMKCDRSNVSCMYLAVLSLGVVNINMLFKVVLVFGSVDEIAMQPFK